MEKTSLVVLKKLGQQRMTSGGHLSEIKVDVTVSVESREEFCDSLCFKKWYADCFSSLQPTQYGSLWHLVLTSPKVWKGISYMVSWLVRMESGEMRRTLHLGGSCRRPSAGSIRVEEGVYKMVVEWIVVVNGRAKSGWTEHSSPTKYVLAPYT